MREADPGIEIMMESYSWKPAREWLPRMLEIAGRAIHHVAHRSVAPSFRQSGDDPEMIRFG